VNSANKSLIQITSTNPLPKTSLRWVHTPPQSPRSIRAMIRIASFCLLAYWLLIFFGTHIPSSALPNLHWSDKILHLLAFAGLAFLMAWAIPKNGLAWWRHLLSVVGITFVYSCLDELTQQFIPGRQCDIGDVVADMAGTLVGLVCYLSARQVLSRLTWGQRLILRLSR
jgi:VanZ family protein